MDPTNENVIVIPKKYRKTHSDVFLHRKLARCVFLLILRFGFYRLRFLGGLLRLLRLASALFKDLLFLFRPRNGRRLHRRAMRYLLFATARQLLSCLVNVCKPIAS